LRPRMDARIPCESLADVRKSSSWLLLPCGADLLRPTRRIPALFFCPVHAWLGLHPNALPDSLRRQSCYSNQLSSALLAGRNGNGRARHLQKFCEEFDAGFVGTSFDGRRCQGDLESVAEYARDSVLLGARMNLNREADCIACLLYGNQLRAPLGERDTDKDHCDSYGNVDHVIAYTMGRPDRFSIFGKCAINHD